ncbi:MAG: tRNA (adenosine(37)-N6)-dimethylallyltransferase MiaA [Bacteroidetes bacterium]|nr:tRNA (adenosine(37)-N6)-dimethylallyltransferase MiaA [Bacteroidota bacterium]
MASKKTLIVLVGPTAVGKTKLSIQLAKKFNSGIISADSRQFYSEISIGTAKPSKEELAEVTHHFINNLSINTNYTVGDYEKQCIDLIAKLFLQHDILFLVGGSGLFVNAICNGLDEMPSGNLLIREELNNQLKENGLDHLLEELKTLDPIYYRKVDKANPQRVIRALEVCKSTGIAFSSFHNRNSIDRPFAIIKIGLNTDRKTLYENINSRVDIMMQEGLLDEVKSVLSYKHLNSLQTVGYKELFDYLDGLTTLENAVELIKQHSRNFAKRQLTWFRKDAEIKWFEPQNQQEIEQYILSKLELRKN